MPEKPAFRLDQNVVRATRQRAKKYADEDLLDMLLCLTLALADSAKRCGPRATRTGLFLTSMLRGFILEITDRPTIDKQAISIAVNRANSVAHVANNMVPVTPEFIRRVAQTDPAAAEKLTQMVNLAESAGNSNKEEEIPFNVVPKGNPTIH